MHDLPRKQLIAAAVSCVTSGQHGVGFWFFVKIANLGGFLCQLLKIFNARYNLIAIVLFVCVVAEIFGEIKWMIEDASERVSKTKRPFLLVDFNANFA